MTYRAALRLKEGVAGASASVMNRDRLVWVLTVYNDEPIKDICGGYGPPSSKDACTKNPAYTVTEVIDAATGDMVDGCTGCASI